MCYSFLYWIHNLVIHSVCWKKTVEPIHEQIHAVVKSYKNQSVKPDWRQITLKLLGLLLTRSLCWIMPWSWEILEELRSRIGLVCIMLERATKQLAKGILQDNARLAVNQLKLSSGWMMQQDPKCGTTVNLIENGTKKTQLFPTETLWYDLRRASSDGWNEILL